MNRLSHLLRAKTQFSLHSPFVYRLYTEVLISYAEGAPKGRYASTVWRLEEYYGLPHTACPLPTPRYSLSTSDGVFLIVDHPHRDEGRWRGLVDSPDWQVTLDLFTVGIAVANPHLSKQHFTLR